MNLWRGSEPPEISGYSIWNSRDRWFLSGSNCLVTRYPGRPILTPPFFTGTDAGLGAVAEEPWDRSASLAARLARLPWCLLPCVCAR